MRFSIFAAEVYPCTIKAVLLAGAAKTDAHGAAWTNNPQTSGPDRGITTQPIDAVIGAGTVNVNFAHWILTGGEQDGAGTPPNNANAMFAGWDLTTVGLDESRYWRFDVPHDEPLYADDTLIIVTAGGNTFKVGNMVEHEDYTVTFDYQQMDCVE